MKKIILVSVLVLAFLVAFAPISNAEIAKEGYGRSTIAFSGQFKILPMGKERVQMTYEFKGIVVESSPEDPFHNSTFRCLGSLHAVKGMYKDDFGFCEYTRPDGDKVYLTYEATGYLGGRGGTGIFKIVGGTGKCSAITGGGEFDKLPGFRPAAQGTFQGMNKSTGHWKIIETKK